SVGGDPHFWLNPFLAKEQAQKITDGFTKLDPASKEYYEANQKNLNERLDEIDKRYKESLANCRQDLVVTSHAAFGYLANRYAFDQVSIAGISPEEEPSPQNLIQVSKFVKDNNIEYIFFETLVSPRLSETIAKETGAKTLVLDPIEGLSQEDMAKGKDYFTLMEQNLENLVIALECTR
ncbi:MAG: zinc ABC transporter substrate-binding protein, partial [Candidatus Wildermuthbacteria bacterium]|nr:zinc ABC transporter substrate-binding protein [Candidatus Wildermuthbacteria bacterium]